jgi:hypothetical protein
VLRAITILAVMEMRRLLVLWFKQPEGAVVVIFPAAQQTVAPVVLGEVVAVLGA